MSAFQTRKHPKRLLKGLFRALSGTAEEGFTMVETLVSIGILAVGLASVLPTFVSAKISLHESQLRIKASYLMNQYVEEISTTPFENIGSLLLIEGSGGRDVNGEEYLHDKADEFFTIREYPDNPTAQERRILDNYVFDIYAHVYYNRDANPYMKYIYVEISYTPYQRRWTTKGTVNVQKLTRVIPIPSFVTESEQ